MDEAMAKISEYAQESLHHHMIPREPKSPHSAGSTSHDWTSHDTSPKCQSFFRLGRTSKSVRSVSPEKPTFIEGMKSSASDLSESLSPEAQEVYNVLVASRTSPESTLTRGPERHSHHNISTNLTTQRLNGTNRSSMTTVSSTVNIRKPRGIPGRGPMASTWRSDVNSDREDPSGGNPLRRLRESKTMTPRPTPHIPTTGMCVCLEWCIIYILANRKWWGEIPQLRQ